MNAAIDILNAKKVEPWNDLHDTLSSRGTSMLVLAIFIPLWVTFPVIHGPLMLWLMAKPLSLSLETKRVL